MPAALRRSKAIPRMFRLMNPKRSSPRRLPMILHRKSQFPKPRRRNVSFFVSCCGCWESPHCLPPCCLAAIICSASGTNLVLILRESIKRLFCFIDMRCRFPLMELNYRILFGYLLKKPLSASMNLPRKSFIPLIRHLRICSRKLMQPSTVGNDSGFVFFPDYCNRKEYHL